MNEILRELAYFGMVLSVFYFWIGTWIRRRFPSPLVNPLLIATIQIGRASCRERV